MKKHLDAIFIHARALYWNRILGTKISIKKVGKYIDAGHVKEIISDSGCKNDVGLG